MSEEKIEFIKFNNISCGCCSLPFDRNKTVNKIKSTQHEIFRILFDFELKSEVVCDDCNKMLTEVYHFRQEILSKTQILEPKIKIELDDFADTKTEDERYEYPELPKIKLKSLRKVKRKRGITYNCCLCKIFTSDNKREYAEHIFENHAINSPKIDKSNSDELHCKICGMECQCRANGPCDECNINKNFNSIRQLLNHKNKYHGRGKRFWCVRCGTLYDSKKQQSICIKSHYDDVLKDVVVKCPECDKELLHNSLKIHIKSVHSQVKEVVCHECGKAFCAVARLTIHMRQVHNNGLKPFQCDDCGRCFSQKKTLRDHILKVHFKNRRKYECPICWKVCYENPDRHMIAVHPNGFDNGIRVNKETNMYHCPKSNCIQKFSIMKAYEWHVNENLCENYGDFEIDQVENEKFNVFTKGKFKCKICNSVQTTLARLRRHQHYVHSGEVNCPVCDKKMRCKRAVIGHLSKVHKTNFTAVMNTTRQIN